jgi:Skp family chaperone for outer membrane proteins
LPLKAELESTRKALEECRHELSAQQSNCQALTLELTRERKLADITAEGHTLEFNSLDQRCRRLVSLLEQETQARRTFEDKAALYDAAIMDNKGLNKEVLLYIFAIFPSFLH